MGNIFNMAALLDLHPLQKETGPTITSTITV